MFKDNIGLRIAALALAILIWLQTVLVSEQKTMVNLPITLLHVPQNITLENIPDKIPFNVKGKGLDIIKILINRPRVNIDASRITPNTDILSLADYSIDLPENLNVSFLGPAHSDQIAIQADVFHQKVLPVLLDAEDDATRERLKELSYQLEPDKISVFGPKNRITPLSSIKTTAIAMSDLDAEELKLSLVLPDKEISISESSVVLHIRGLQEATRIFTNLPLPPKYLPGRVAVKIQAERSVLDKISLRDLLITVDENASENGMHQVLIEAPEAVKVIAITPDKVRQRR